MANLIQNGGFEYNVSTNIAANWIRSTGTYVSYVVITPVSSNGNNSYAFKSGSVSSTSLDTVEQTPSVSTTIGAKYRLSFYFSTGSLGSTNKGKINVDIGDTTLEFTEITGNNDTWVLQTYDYTATSTSTLFRFRCWNEPSYTYITGVSLILITPIYVPPSIPTIDIVNTKTVALGNLQVSITDTNNLASNKIYYLYSVNSTPPNSNSYVLNVGSGGSPYRFFINNITDISNIIYVRARDSTGNTSGTSSTPVIVFQKPRVPPIFDVSFVGSGNLQVTVGESFPAPSSFYYLNNVSYVAYLYTGGTNQSGNLSFYTYNVGILASTNTTYVNVVSYIPNLVANTYTVYLAAKNTFGNSLPTTTSKTISVYTTPIAPVIDFGNTKSLTSGNLTVSITDTQNSFTNGIYYLYSTDDITYGNVIVPRTSGNTRYTFTINNTGNSLIPLVANKYRLYVSASNPLINVKSTPYDVPVYTTPVFSPIIDTGNTQCTSSGNLTVSITDTQNSATNGVYYLYSMDGINYANSRVPTTAGNTQYTFTINNTGNAQVPLVANTYTLYVAAANPIGNSISSPSTATEIVYTTPFAPIIDIGNTKSITSGNLNVAFTDPSNNANNQVEYTYIIYDPTSAPLFFYVSS